MGSTSTPFSRRLSVNTVSAKRVGDGTTYLKRIGDLPAGKLPAIVTFCLPSEPAGLPVKRMSGSESALPVFARFTKVTYEVVGDEVKASGAPSLAPGVT